MAAIIEKQRVSKRRKTSSSRLSNKSAGFNAGFMNQIHQKPAHSKKKKTPLFTRFKKTETIEKTPKKRQSNARVNSRSKDQRSGFSFKVPSLATLAVVAGIMVIAMAALNIETINIRTPNIYAFKPSEDAETAEKRVIQYAATGIPGIFPEKIEKNETPIPESGITSETAALNKANDNPHGMLVTFEWQKYKVQRGDSISAIAQKFGVSVGAVIASNEIKNARRLQEGASLRIPNIDGIPYQIQRGDNLSKISTSFNVPLEVILDVNDIKSDNIKPGEVLFIPGARMNDIDLKMSLGELFMYPLQGRRIITSYYGMRKDPISGVLQFHAGVDFRANTGTTVMAALDGTVSVTGENWLYGKYIIMSHGNGYKTLYGHLNSFAVKQGDRIARGRKIGEVGNTGYSTGPHLHFGIYDKNNKLVNPLELLN